MGEIKINVSGGNAQFGNVSQGDNNTLEASWQSWYCQENLDKFDASLRALEEAQRASSAEIEALKGEIAGLTEVKEKPDLVERVRQLYEKYAWAAEPLKGLFALVL